MKLTFTFEGLHSIWSPQIIFNKYFEWFSNQDHDGVEFEHVNLPIDERKNNPSGIFSPHIMTIRNLVNKKYMIISYWDRAVDLTWPYNGWDHENCVDFITSAGVHTEMDFTPSTYCGYSSENEFWAKKYKLPFNERKNNGIFFRGYLYSTRKDLSVLRPDIFTDFKIPNHEYMEELAQYKIGLSLNGAAEICNRDMEILSVGSVLLRPELHQKFHNPLIPNVHYVPFRVVMDPNEQMDIILQKQEELLENEELMRTISENGYQWYLENGTIESNINILKKIIDINKLK